MSYILEALKKSERQRLGDAVPNLQSDHGDPAAARTPPWLLWLVPVLGLNALVLAWLLSTRTQETVPGHDAPIQEMAAVDARAITGENGAPALTADPGSKAAEVERRAPPIQTRAGPAQVSVQASATRPERNDQPGPPPVSPTPPAAAPQSAHAADTTAMAPELKEEEITPTSDGPVEWEAGEDISSLENPTGDRRDGLPELDITIHAYGARPAARLVRINGRIFHEGDQVDEDLVLESITEDGMILAFRGERVHVPAAGR